MTTAALQGFSLFAGLKMKDKAAAREADLKVREAIKASRITAAAAKSRFSVSGGAPTRRMSLLDVSNLALATGRIGAGNSA